MHRLAVPAALLLGLASLSVAADPVRVPKGKPVLLDGRLGTDEWKDAAQLPLGDVARVYVKESDGFIWLAVEFLAAPTGTLDLYLTAADGKLYDLHASAKLGERVLTSAEWGNEWTWWNNEGWTATFARIDTFEPRRFKDDKAREFQIARSRFPGKEWRVMFDVMTRVDQNWSTTRFPTTAKNTEPRDWYTLRFAR